MSILGEGPFVHFTWKKNTLIHSVCESDPITLSVVAGKQVEMESKASFKPNLMSIIECVLIRFSQYQDLQWTPLRFGSDRQFTFRSIVLFIINL